MRSARHMYQTGALRPADGTDFEAGRGCFSRDREEGKDQDRASSEDLPKSEIDEEAKMGLPQEQEAE